MNFKSIILGSPLGTLLFSSVNAQGVQVIKSAAQGATKATLNTQLARRVQESMLQAQQIKNAYPQITHWGNPSKQFINDFCLAPGGVLSLIPVEKLYPHAPFLTPQHLPNYFLAKNNLETVKWMPILERSRQAILNHLDLLRQNTTPITHAPSEDMAWLAKQVTDKTSYLLLGEMKHSSPLTSGKVVQLMHELRLTQPQERPIFLFTEFLHEGQLWGNLDMEDIVYEEYISVWENIAEEKISIIGLEPSFVAEYEPFLQYEQIGEHVLTGDVIWTSIEGVRLRNQYWKKTLEQYRAQYPEALFVVYAGAGHLEYTAPYSLGRTFSNEHILNVVLDPVQNGEITKIGIFETAVNGSFPDRVLQFTDKPLARLAGFDVRILLEE